MKQIRILVKSPESITIALGPCFIVHFHPGAIISNRTKVSWSSILRELSSKRCISGLCKPDSLNYRPCVVMRVRLDQPMAFLVIYQPCEGKEIWNSMAT